MFKSRLIALALALGLTSAAHVVQAQEYPTKPVRLILPFAPGGSTDLIARMVASHLTERLGKQFVVDNRAGAGGTVGTDVAFSAPADGYTLLIVSSALTMNPSFHKTKFDLAKDFAPVAMFGTALSALVVHPSVPVNTLPELLALAKAKPDALRIGHAGVGSFQHLAVASFAHSAGIKLVEIPFKGGGPALLDVLGGHTELLISALISVQGHVKSGKLKVLGISDKARSPLLPDVPTIAEAGVPGYEAVNWFGLATRTGTPQPFIDKLHKEVTAALSTDAAKQQFEKEGSQVVPMSPAEFGRLIVSETARWAKVVRDAGIKAQ